MERGQNRGDDFGLGDERYDAEAPATRTSQSVDVVDTLEQGGPIDARVVHDSGLGRLEDCGLPSCIEGRAHHRAATRHRHQPHRHQPVTVVWSPSEALQDDPSLPNRLAFSPRGYRLPAFF